MTDLYAAGKGNASQRRLSVDEYRRQEKALETACKQFEGTMFSKLWKDMLKSARTIGGEEKKREYGPLEDTVVEMVSEHLSESQGIGVWKVLYDQLHANLQLPEELAVSKEHPAAVEGTGETPRRRAGKV